ncbi:MAG: Mediator of RNA polymerase II transcription subunit 18 [Heterodermia speciosa]|uniref:Mediator of RNA polymerase II transcription subunit 18 n=1 Tax=Heterodermia speciosa TaxID=116794 RepID=A0A8H3INX1_9LECA|nr:MAG: Mediator of RNA polymerase II transcription subunit 18 [Heterodermia speciosa]
MHELLLHAVLPSHRHHQVLSVLAGIAAMQPIPISEKNLVFKPQQQPAGPAGRPNPNQGVGAQMKPLQGQMHGDLFYLKLVGETSETGEKAGGTEVRVKEVDEKEEGKDRDVDMLDAPHGNDTSPTTDWTLQFRDLPDPPGRRPVTSRAMTDTPITAGDPLKFMKAMEYTLTTTYHLHGHRLTHNAIDIRLYQLFLPDAQTPLDPSGSYVLQTALRVADGQNVERMQEGVRQLTELKETLKGVVELEMGDRLALDTRVR